MKYIIISLQTGKVEKIGPLMLVKANPINDTQQTLDNVLSEDLRKESQITRYFAFKISIALIDAFASAINDCKAGKFLWEPDMSEYEESRIIDFDNKEIVAYKHISLSLNQNADPNTILGKKPQKKTKKIQPRKKRIIKRPEVLNLIDYIKSGTNSFDYLLREYDRNQKVYAFPVLVTSEHYWVFSRCRFSQFGNEGVYLFNDIIKAQESSPDYLRHSLICSGFNRYYTSYKTQEEININYYFYSKEATHLIYNLFNEIAYPIPFGSNKIVNMYETYGLDLTQSEYVENKQKQITEEDIIGFVCCQVKDSGGNVEAALYMLTYEPIKNERCTLFNIYDSERYDVYLKSKYLESSTTKIMMWAFTYDLQKKAGIKSDMLAINDQNNLKLLFDYIASNYEAMSDNDKDMCAYLLPEEYNLTERDSIQSDWLHSYVTNLGTLVRNFGLVFGCTAGFFITDVPEQINKVSEIISKGKRLLLKPSISYEIDAILALITINLRARGPYKELTALWAFYHLLYLNKNETSNLISEMILMIYKSNQDVFTRLLGQVKNNEIIETHTIKKWFREKSVEVRYSWSSYDNMYCYFELFTEYSNNGQGFDLNEYERNFFSPRFVSEMELDVIDRYFSINPSDNHTNSNIEQQRHFYKSKMEEYILDRIEKGDILFKDIINTNA